MPVPGLARGRGCWTTAGLRLSSRFIYCYCGAAAVAFPCQWLAMLQSVMEKFRTLVLVLFPLPCFHY